MKNLLWVAFLFCLSACSSKWDKETQSKKCIDEMKKQNVSSKGISDDMAKKICDCSAEKMVAKYKSESEADGNKVEVEKIGADCALEAMMGTDKNDSQSHP